MLSLIAPHTHIPDSHHPFFLLFNCGPPLVFDFNFFRTATAASLKRAAVVTRFKELKVGRTLERSCCCWCQRDAELEAEIMEFMAKSQKPTMFPTKSELIQAGRMDLVESIRSKGGWLSLGWDEDVHGYAVGDGMDFDIREFQGRLEESASSREFENNSSSSEDGGISENNSDSGSSDSPSTTSRESGAAKDAGIEGILSRLEKQRKIEFEISLERTGYKSHAESEGADKNGHFHTSLGGAEFARTSVGGNGRLNPGFHHKDILNTGKSSQNIEPETWRTWSNQRAGFQYSEFEEEKFLKHAAAEISYTNNQMVTDKEPSYAGLNSTTEESAEGWYEHRDFSPDQIRSRLEHLETELTTTLHSLRSKGKEYISEEVTGSSGDLQKLSDAIEFHENEVMSAKEILRLIRAKLSVLEGKMSLAINDAQKIVELKQRQVDGANKALQLLRTTSIVWPNSASEVLLAGSFDGWTTQRKMDKSKTGVFSVSLKLYPGRYEIKFIVDGAWKVDPLRPIVNNNGFENNLLIVT